MKGFLIGIIWSLTLVPCWSQADSTQSISRNKIVEYAKSHLGTPYKYGGSSPKGFDCSGFVHFVFAHFNISVSRTSRGFKGMGNSVTIDDAQAGDIMLFTGTNANERQIGHVGIILRNENGTVDFIHSSSSKKHYGVTITRFNDSGYEKRFLNIIDILS